MKGCNSKVIQNFNRKSNLFEDYKNTRNHIPHAFNFPTMDLEPLHQSKGGYLKTFHLMLGIE